MELRDMIREVVRGFLGQTGSLNDLIADLARRESLNEHMVRRVCEGANTETRLHYYRQPDINQAAALFPVADAESILATLFPEASEPSMSVDYMLPPDKATVKVITIDEVPVEKAATVMPRNLILEKEAALQNAYYKYQDARSDFFDQVRQHILWDNDPSDINKMASFVDDQATLKAVFPKLEEYLVAKKLEKAAAPIESYLNKDLNVTYVVGDNPLVIKYKNLDRCRQHIVGEIHHPVMKENIHDISK